MKLITKDVDYAVKTLKYMARKGDGIYSVSRLSDDLGISLPYLRKILQKLNKKSILTSYKGKTGGFKLAKSPGHISLHDIIEIFQGSLDLSNCFFGKESCPDKTKCLVRKNVKEIEAFAVRKFKDITVKSLISGCKATKISP